ncbi:MAG: DnaB-like helicase C-terminal domain-containing protein, partial [Pseudomonadota bacterium]
DTWFSSWLWPMEVYKGISHLFKEGHPIDLFTVSRYFFDRKILEFKDAGQISYFLCTLMQGVNSSAHLEFWCLKLRELSAQRIMLTLTHSGLKSGDIFDAARDIDAKIKKALEIKTTDDWAHISTVGIKTVNQIESRDANTIPGISTSINTLDTLNGGFRNGDLVIIGARPSVGKSAFMGRIATYAAAKGSIVGIISLEMEDTAIFTRMVSAESETEFYKIDRNNMKEAEQRAKVYASISTLSTLPIYFSDTAQVNAWDIRAKAEKLKRKHGLDILIVDYLQLIEPESNGKTIREQEVAKISRNMKLLAKTLQIPVIVLAQLNRAAADKKDSKPELHHLRESGSIEQDADVVMFLHRDFMAGVVQNAAGESTEKEADLLVRKWRNGAPMEIKLGFEPEQMRFIDPDKVKPHFEDKPPGNPQAGFQRPSKAIPETFWNKD